MRTLREYLGVLLAVCLVAVPALLLPRLARTGLERLLRETLVTPAQVLTSWVLLRTWAAGIGVETAHSDTADPEAQLEALRRKWQSQVPLPPGHGLRSTSLYRAAFELAFRERYAPLRQFVPAPILSRRDESFREALRLGCGRRRQVSTGAAVFSPEGYLVGLVDDAMLITSTLSCLGADHLRIHCDVLGRDGVQGILAGPWRQRLPGGLDAQANCLELQVISRGTSVSPGDGVVTSSFAGSRSQMLVPGGIPVGSVDAVEPTEEGYVRARVRLPAAEPRRVLYVESNQAVVDGRPAETDPAAAQARCLADLRRLTAFQRDQVPGAIVQLTGIRTWAGAQANGMAQVAFAIRYRAAETFYETAEPAGPDAVGLRPGLACLAHGGLAGVTVAEGNALRVRLLTSPAMPVNVEVLQPNGVRYRGLLAAADGRQAREAVPEGWYLPGQPRLQLVTLDNDGLPLQLPAQVVTAAGGAVALPPGIPVGELVGAQDDPLLPPWLMRPSVDFGALTYCVALVPTVTHAVSPQGGSLKPATRTLPPRR
jgi:hypothetical protein